MLGDITKCSDCGLEFDGIAGYYCGLCEERLCDVCMYAHIDKHQAQRNDDHADHLIDIAKGS